MVTGEPYAVGESTVDPVNRARERLKSRSSKSFSFRAAAVLPPAQLRSAALIALTDGSTELCTRSQSTVAIISIPNGDSNPSITVVACSSAGTNWLASALRRYAETTSRLESSNQIRSNGPASLSRFSAV